MRGTLNFTLCEAQCFTAVSPPLHLAKPNFTKCLKIRIQAQKSQNWHFIVQSSRKRKCYLGLAFLTNCALRQISAPSVREAMLRIVKFLRTCVAHLTSLCAKHNASRWFCRRFMLRSHASPEMRVFAFVLIALCIVFYSLIVNWQASTGTFQLQFCSMNYMINTKTARTKKLVRLNFPLLSCSISHKPIDK